MLDHGWIDADGGGGWDVRASVRAECFLAEGSHFSRGVLALKGGEIYHGGGQFKAEYLGVFLDAASRKFRHSLFNADVIDGADICDQAAKCKGSV